MGKTRRRRHAETVNLRASGPAMALPQVNSGPGVGVSFAQSSPALESVRPAPAREQEFLYGADLRTVWAKAARLEMECPYFKGPLESVATYLGPVTPVANTDDAEWNQIANRWFKEEYWDLGLWGASRKLSSPAAQMQLSVYADTYGDVLPVLTEDPDGVPCVRTVVASGVDSPWESYSPASRWQDGVRLGLHHRHEAYWVLKREDAPTRLMQWDRAGYEVSARDAVMLGNFKEGGPRGFSRLIVNGKTIVQMEMYDNATHEIVNLAAKVGFSLETEAGQSTGQMRGLSGLVQGQVVPGAVVNAAGDTADVKQYVEQFKKGGPALIKPEAGQSLKLQNFADAVPNLTELRGGDYERIAMAYGLPVQILFCIMSGAFNVTGPNVRLALGRAKTWRDQELLKRVPLVKRHYARVMEWAIRTGQLPRPKKDARYWRCKENYAKNYTIDEARDVKNDELRLKMNATTFDEIADEYGSNAADNMKRNVEFVTEMYQKIMKEGGPVSYFFPAEKVLADAAAADAAAAGGTTKGTKDTKV